MMRIISNYYFSICLLIVFLLSSSLVFSQNEYAIDLDGSESCFVNDDGSDNLDITGDYTFECWIYVRVAQQYDRVFDRRTVCDLRIMDPIGAGVGHDYGIWFNERDGSDNILRSIKTNDSAEDMTLNTWYHIAVTFDGTVCRLYVNENLVGSFSESLWSLSASTNALNIGGRYWGSADHQIDAIIDELRVSKIARSISDMQTDSHWEEYASDANTVLLMHFDDQEDNPTYETGVGLTGTTGGYNFDHTDYSSSDIDSPDFILQPKYRSKTTGNWNDLSSWEVEKGAGNYVDATNIPTRYYESIDILNSHTISIASGNSFTAYNLNINSGGTLNQSGELAVYGDISNAGAQGNFHLNSTSSGSASLITYGTVSGVAEMDCYFSTLSQWYLVASPMVHDSANVFINQYLDYWNEVTSKWVGIEDSATILNPMQGYSAKKETDHTATYDGVFNTGDQSYTLSYTANGAAFGDGWNLIGNPYPSSIDWSLVTIPTGMNAGVSLWKDVSGGKRKYVVWNSGVGNDSARYIPPGQGMMAQATTNGTVLNFSNAIRTHTNASGFEKGAQESQDTIAEVLQITSRANGTFDDTYIRYKEDAGTEFNGQYEVHKLMSNDIEIPQIFSFAEEEKLAINALPPPDDEEVVHLGIDMGVNSRTSL